MTPTIEQLIESSHRVLRHLISAKTAPEGLSCDEYMVLRNAEDPMSLGQLARLLRIDTPSMSRLVHGLEQRGYLAVTKDPEHKRKICIQITESGMGACGIMGIRPYFDNVHTEMMTSEMESNLRTLLMTYLEGLDVAANTDLPGKSLRRTKATI